MNRPDDSFSDFETGTFEQLQRNFTDIQLINQTHTHLLYRAKGLFVFFSRVGGVGGVGEEKPSLFGRAKSSASKRASAHAAGGGDGGQCRCDCCHDDL